MALCVFPAAEIVPYRHRFGLRTRKRAVIQALARPRVRRGRDELGPTAEAIEPVGRAECGRFGLGHEGDLGLVPGRSDGVGRRRL